jgi:hypothetical protein
MKSRNLNFLGGEHWTLHNRNFGGENIGPYTTEIYKMAHGTYNDIKECDGL